MNTNKCFLKEYELKHSEYYLYKPSVKNCKKCTFVQSMFRCKLIVCYFSKALPICKYLMNYISNKILQNVFDSTVIACFQNFLTELIQPFNFNSTRSRGFLSDVDPLFYIIMVLKQLYSEPAI